MTTLKIENPYFKLYRSKFENLTEQSQISQEQIQTLLEQFALVHNCSIQMFYDVTQVISVLYSSIEEKEKDKACDNKNEQKVKEEIQINNNDNKMKEEFQVNKDEIENQDPNSSQESNSFNFMDYFSYQPQQITKNTSERQTQFKTKSKNPKHIKFPFQPRPINQKKIKLDNVKEEPEQLNKSLSELLNSQPKEERKQNLNKTKVYKIQFEKDDSQLSQDPAAFNLLHQQKNDKDIPLLQQQTLDKLWQNKEKDNQWDNKILEEEKINEEKPARQVHKKKSERQILKGHACVKCEKFYEALGLKDNENQELCQCVSRHRYDYALPSTPDIFYNDDTFI